MSRKEISRKAVHDLPPDLRKAITSAPAAQQVWEDITPRARNEWICWVTSGKKKKQWGFVSRRRSQNSLVVCADPAAGQGAYIVSNLKRFPNLLAAVQ